jgi:hypothetical protein
VKQAARPNAGHQDDGSEDSFLLHDQTSLRIHWQSRSGWHL